MGNPKDREVILIKPILWRQLGFTFFLFLCAVFFAFINFLGTVASWIVTVLMLVSAILNLADQLITWSRLRIDSQGYDLRTWWGRKKIAHKDIQSFELDEYMHRKLIFVKFRTSKKSSGKKENVPFPCAFGRPVEDVYKVLEENLDKTPKPID